MNKLSFKFISEESGLDDFWELRDRYMAGDILPNCDPPVTDDEKEWFFSSAYKERITALFLRKTDTLRIAYLHNDGVYSGFIVYVIYGSEDGKCFILEYCIERSQRGAGLGTAFFKQFAEAAELEGARYFALNTSNDDNRRFWASLGFVRDAVDEHGNDVYIRR